MKQDYRPSWMPDDERELTGAACGECHRDTAMICTECARAVTLGYWAAISRHPESVRKEDERCRLCRAGVAALCACCFPAWCVAYGRSLRQGPFADGA